MLEIVDSKHGKYVKFKDILYCPFCGYPMIPHSFTCGKHKDTLFVNIHYKCPNRGFYATFGITVDNETWNMLKQSPLHGKFYPEEIYLEEARKLKVEDKVKERLEKWGYF